MRLPPSPPDPYKIFAELTKKTPQEDILANKKLIMIMTGFQPTDSKNRYVHWDKLRYLKPPENLTSEEYWAGIKLARRGLLKTLPFKDKYGKPFVFGMPDSVLKALHEIDKQASGQISTQRPTENPRSRDMYLINSLIKEAVNSSQLEGATTTLKVAKEMIRRKRQPKNRSEQMIWNNYQAMQFIRRFKNEDLTPQIVLELHRIVTENTLDHPEDAGKLREKQDNVQIIDDRDGEILHIPPDAEELSERLEKLCDFANDPNPSPFIHPVIKGVLLHFMLAYDHPFVDGNGRTARALFYWHMVKSGYWLIEFTSISGIIKQAPIKYGRAFLYTETDDNDTTYFIIHQLKVIQRAIDELYNYLRKKEKEMSEAQQLLIRTKLDGKLNHRQIAVLEHALRHPHAVYRFKEHQNTHAVSYQTARTDLLEMADELKLLIKTQEGKSLVFLAPADLQERLQNAKL